MSKSHSHSQWVLPLQKKISGNTSETHSELCLLEDSKSSLVENEDGSSCFSLPGLFGLSLDMTFRDISSESSVQEVLPPTLRVTCLYSRLSQ